MSGLLPPILTVAGALEFRSTDELSAHLAGELGAGRLLAIDLLGLPLFEARSLSLQISGRAGLVEITAQVVHRQGDMIGLALEMTPALRTRLTRLAQGEELHDERPARPSLGLRPPSAAVRPPSVTSGPRPMGPASITSAPRPATGGLGRAETPRPAPREEPRRHEPALGPRASKPSRGLYDLLTPPPRPLEELETGFGERPTSGVFDRPPSGVFDRPPTSDTATLEPSPERLERQDTGGLLMSAPPSPRLERQDTGGLLTSTPPRPQTSGPRAEHLSAQPTQGGLQAEPTRAQVVRVKSVYGNQGEVRGLGGVRDLLARQATLFSLLMSLSREGRSGRIELQPAGGRSMWLLMDRRGRVVDVDADLSAPLFEARLIDPTLARKVSREPGTNAQARMLQAESPEPIESTTIRRALRTVLVARLATASNAAEVTFSCDPDYAAKVDLKVGLHFLEYAPHWLEARLAEARMEGLEPLIGERIARFPTLNTDPDWNAFKVPLGKLQERFLKEHLPLGRPLRELLNTSPLGRGPTIRLVFALEALEMLDFKADRP